jgi:hypothetical protein
MENNTEETAVNEATQKENDLRARLLAATKTKDAAQQNAGAKSFYDNDDFAEEKKTNNTAAPKAENKTEVQTGPVTKISQGMKEASANSIIGIVDITSQLFIPIHNKKFQKKFNEEEIKKLDTLTDKEEDDIDDKDDLALKKKFERLIKRHNKKIDQIPLNESEKKDMKTQLMAYMDYKEKALPPEIGLVFCFMNILGKRIIDVSTD